MLLEELFSVSRLRETRIVINGGPTGDTPVSRFMKEFFAKTQPSMFNQNQRVYGMAMLEMSPSVNDRAHRVHIHDIVSRVKGEGSKALAFVCELADAHGVTLELHAMGYASTPTAKLVEWYSRYGFVESPDYFGSDDDGYEMIREPKKNAPEAPVATRTIKLKGFNKRPH